MSESETERLRRRLEELGVFCLPYPENNQHTPRLCWKGDDDHDGYCYFFEDDFHVTELLMTALTAEQAIEATIARGKCHMKLLPDEQISSIQPMRCTSCGHKTYAQLASYCPHCGAKVVQE